MLAQELAVLECDRCYIPHGGGTCCVDATQLFAAVQRNGRITHNRTFHVCRLSTCLLVEVVNAFFYTLCPTFAQMPNA